MDHKLSSQPLTDQLANASASTAVSAMDAATDSSCELLLQCKELASTGELATVLDLVLRPENAEVITASGWSIVREVVDAFMSSPFCRCSDAPPSSSVASSFSECWSQLGALLTAIVERGRAKELVFALLEAADAWRDSDELLLAALPAVAVALRLIPHRHRLATLDIVREALFTRLTNESLPPEYELREVVLEEEPRRAESMARKADEASAAAGSKQCLPTMPELCLGVGADESVMPQLRVLDGFVSFIESLMPVLLLPPTSVPETASVSVLGCIPESEGRSELSLLLVMLLGNPLSMLRHEGAALVSARRIVRLLATMQPDFCRYWADLDRIVNRMPDGNGCGGRGSRVETQKKDAEDNDDEEGFSGRGVRDQTEGSSSPNGYEDKAASGRTHGGHHLAPAAMANFVYVVLCGGECLDSVPWVLDAVHLFEVHLRSACVLLSVGEAVEVEKGLVLLRHLLARVGRLPDDLAKEHDDFCELLRTAGRNVCLSSMARFRREFQWLIPELLSKLASSAGRHAALTCLLHAAGLCRRDCTSGERPTFQEPLTPAGVSLASFVLQLIKNQVRVYRGSGDPYFDGGAPARCLLEPAFALPSGPETDLVEQYDRLMAGLNVACYLQCASRGQPIATVPGGEPHRSSGWRRTTETLREMFLQPLDECLTKARLRYGAERERLRAKLTDSAQRAEDVVPPDAMEVSVGGARLSAPAPSLAVRSHIDFVETALMRCDLLGNLLQHALKLSSL